MLTDEQRALVDAHDRLVLAYSAMYARRVPEVDRRDLQQAGRLALCVAATRYNAALRVPFNAFARLYVRGAVVDYLRKDRGASGIARRRVRRAVEMQWGAVPGGRLRDGEYAEFDVAAPVVDLDRAVDIRRMRAALRGLPWRHRVAVTGLALGLGQAAVSAALGGRPATTVFYFRRRALEELRLTLIRQ